MKAMIKKKMDNQEGFVMVAAILILVIVSLSGLYAITNSNTELRIIRNTQQMTLEFYEAEAGLIEALENKDVWMTDPFLTSGEVVPAGYEAMDEDSGGNPTIAIMDVRPIRKIAPTAPEIVAGHSEYAYDLPLQQHKAAPPAGSGYSLKFFETRRYGITASSQNGNTTLQGGAWKIFNKY